MGPGTGVDDPFAQSESVRDRHDRDLQILSQLEPEVSAWWLEQFGEHTPQTGGLLTPPQREAIPAIRSRENTLICSPTGSGKCVHPATPIIVRQPDGRVMIRTAGALLANAGPPIARVDGSGWLHASSNEVYAYRANEGRIRPAAAGVYTERYEGPLVSITTATGHHVSVTPDHPLLVQTSSGPEWRPAKEVAIDDIIGGPSALELPERSIETADTTFVISHPSMDERGDPTGIGSLTPGPADRSPERQHIINQNRREAIIASQPPVSRQTRITPDQSAGWVLTLPPEIDRSLARIAAHLVADERGIVDASSEKIKSDRLRGLIATAVDIEPVTRSQNSKSPPDIELIHVLRSALRMEPTESAGIRFPDWILNAPKPIKRTFLKEFLQTAGTFDGEKIHIRPATDCPATVHQLCYLLLAFGISVQRIDRPNSSTPWLEIDGTALKRIEAESSLTPTQDPSAEAEPPIRWSPITAITQSRYAGPIIDLTVPGPANFVGGTGGLFLHNTLAAFTGIINELFAEAKQDTLENSVKCLYISPLKSLANDIHRNLEVPLSGIAERNRTQWAEAPIRHAIRHGDTGSRARNEMLTETPHILNTTPETLAILLNSPKFREKLRTVEFVIVDEIHSVADNKRGTHLAVSLERIETLVEEPPTRIGCSATIEPIDTVAEFLVGRETSGGPPRQRTIVDTRFSRPLDLELFCPSADLIGTPRWELQDRFYERLNELIQTHENTIVFTNTRSGAERVLYNLRERFAGYDEDTAACHHGSLSESQRNRVEQGLKAGAFKVVTTSTSLELGIDMPAVDLVVQVGSPKSVAALLQRVGRAGHQLGRTVTGRVIALDIDDLIECSVMVRAATDGFVDRIHIPENAQDVAAQHVYGMAINAVRTEDSVRSTLTRAYPYRNYGSEEWESLIRYLTADYDAFEDRHVYAKIWRDENDPPGGEHHHSDFPPGQSLIGRRGRLARPIYLTNVGTIPDSFTCQVFTRADNEWVGNLDEEYLDTLSPGDVFILGGNRYEFRYRRGAKVYVDNTEGRPTVPSWYSERLPLTVDLGSEILEFQSELLDTYALDGAAAVREWLRGFPIDENAVRALTRLYTDQIEYASVESVSTPSRLVIEEVLDRDHYKRRYYVHSNYGRRVNDGFSRLLGHKCATASNRAVRVAVADNGFVVNVPLNQRVDLPTILQALDPESIRSELRSAIQGTDLLQRQFRINATRALMILKRYKGYEKTASEQQVSSEMLLGVAHDLENFAVLEETYREILEDKLAVDTVREIVAAINSQELEVVHVTVPSPSPRAFGLATLSTGDVVLAADESEALQQFHAEVTRRVASDEQSDATETE